MRTRQQRCQELLLDLQGMWLVGEADLRCVDFKLLVLGLPSLRFTF
jgi:hypothetical protein